MSDYYISERQVTSRGIIYEYDIYDAIECHEQYKDLIADLKDANENDIFILKINSPGGNLDVGMMVVRAIKKTRANVIAKVVFPSASMAALIATACHGIVFEKNTELMFHSYAGGYYGRAHELVGGTNSGHKHYSGMFNDCIGKFLSKAEVKKMWEGAEVRISWDCPDLQARIDRHFPLKIEELK